MAVRLSACVIVRNAAACLPRCLGALNGWAEEVVVLDAGASDDTEAIARPFGAVVFPHAWQDDLAAARNAAIAHATGDWILCLDADETLAVGEAEAFRAALADSSHGGFRVNVGTADEDGGRLDAPEVRLFRRDARLRFRGRLHAQVEAALADQRLAVGELAAVLLQQAARPSTPEALAHDVRIAERDAEERSHAPDAWLALAESLLAAGRDREALAVFERLQALVARTGAPDAVAFGRARSLAALHARLGQPQSAERALDAGIERLPNSPVLRLDRAQEREARGELRGAIADLRTCLWACREPDQHPRPRDLATQAQALLGRILERAPELAGEAALDREAELVAQLAENPRQPGLLLELAFRYFQQARLEEALQAIFRCLELDAGLVPALHVLGMILDHAGQPVYAEKIFAASLELEPNNPMALSCREACRGKEPAQALAPELGARIERLLERLHPTLSACLILKNEAEKLPRCLKSLEGWVDEIVVVDTGSTDETVAIAESFGAKVRHFTWCDDFAAARNAGLELATGDWILSVDADETLEIRDAEAFRRALRNRTCGGYLVTLHNYGERGVFSTNLLLRLFQRHERVRFANRLHEHVTGAIDALGWPVAELGAVVIAHDGYVIAPEAFDDKLARNRRIARAAAEAEPENPYLWFELGRAARNGAPEEALAAFERVERLLAAGGELSKAVYPTYVTLYQRLLRDRGRADAASALLDGALEHFPGHAELHYERGLLRAQRGDSDGARRDFLACLTPNAYTGSQRREGITFELPQRALAELELPCRNV